MVSFTVFTSGRYAPAGTSSAKRRRYHCDIGSYTGLTPAAASRGADIRKFEEVGTHPAANHNAIAEAIAFNEGIGAGRKIARLRYLRDRWATRARQHPRVRLHTDLSEGRSGAIATVQIVGIPAPKIVEQLWSRWRIIATPIVHAEYEGVRVTPNVYTTLEEVDTFAAAIEHLAQKGVPTA